MRKESEPKKTIRNTLQYSYIYVYIYIEVSFLEKKVGILATGCNRYGANNYANWQKNDAKLPKSTQNQRKTSPYQQG